jgi:hypothetical protein
MAVTQVFREFGPVFVKIRRDIKQMPFAFCQFTVSTSNCFQFFADQTSSVLSMLSAPFLRVVVA